MNSTEDSFNQILAHYVFKVASHYIESVEPSTQAQVINLLNKVTQSVDKVDPVTNLPGSEVFEWEQVLEEPIDWKSVHEQWLASINRARINRYRLYMTRLEKVIETTHCRWQQMQVSQLTEPRRSQLATYYEQTLTSYQQQLAQALKSYEFYCSHAHPSI